ncbi:nitroreductase family protein [Catenulispora rubra]|uniref:nitroreductase family protein n=1 Tax=Catenulispora rubra TaxID=280293 RepID=UPI001892879E|nr:nitroreductase family protein [Catenulispora rubra]
MNRTGPQPSRTPVRLRANGVPLPTGSSFQQALVEAAAVANLSPSSHNCQPWGHAWLKSDRAKASAYELLDLLPGHDDATAGDPDNIYLALAQDTDRSLTALPAHSAEMHLSCGSYWHLLLRALAAQGWVPTAVHHIEPEALDHAAHRAAADSDWPRNWRMLSLAVLSRTGIPRSADLTDLRATATARHTNRAPYRDLRVAPEALHELAHLSPTAWATSNPPHVTVRHLRSPVELRRLATFIAHHAGRDFSDSAAWRETHSYFRWSAEDAAARPDGFTPEQVFGAVSTPRRLLARVALNPAALPHLCRLGFDRYLGTQLAKTVHTTPVITAAGLPTDTPTAPDLLSAGMWLANYWLTATQAGLALHPLSILTQHEDLRSELQQRFGLPGRTFFVARLGHPTTTTAATLRHTAATLTL